MIRIQKCRREVSILPIEEVVISQIRSNPMYFVSRLFNIIIIIRRKK